MEKKPKVNLSPLGVVSAFNERGELFEIDLDKRPEFKEREDVKDWLVMISRAYTYWSVLCFRARDIKEVAKVQEGEVEAEVYGQIKDVMLREMNSKDIKETEIKHRVASNAKVASMTRNRLRSEDIYMKLTGVVASLEFVGERLKTWATIYAADTRIGE